MAAQLWTDETKVEVFEHHTQQHVWQKPNAVHHTKHLIPYVKHIGGGAMILAHFAATGSGNLHWEELHDKSVELKEAVLFFFSWLLSIVLRFIIFLWAVTKQYSFMHCTDETFVLFTPFLWLLLETKMIRGHTLSKSNEFMKSVKSFVLESGKLLYMCILCIHRCVEVISLPIFCFQIWDLADSERKGFLNKQVSFIFDTLLRKSLKDFNNEYTNVCFPRCVFSNFSLHCV